MPFPKMARTGIIRRKITTIPPIKFPTNISGLCSDTAVSPTANSGMEVRIPRIKKERANEESLSFLEMISTEDIISPEPNHIVINETKYIVICSPIIHLIVVYISSVVQEKGKHTRESNYGTHYIPRYIQLVILPSSHHLIAFLSSY